MSTIRREPTYLSTEVWRACWLLARTRASENGQSVTADEMADTLLRVAINERFPQIFEHQKQIAKLESELLKTLK